MHCWWPAHTRTAVEGPRGQPSLVMASNDFQWKVTASPMSLRPMPSRHVPPRIIVQDAKTGRQMAQRQGSRQSVSRNGSFFRSASSVGEMSRWDGSRTPSGNATPLATPLAGVPTVAQLSLEYVFQPAADASHRKDVHLAMPAPVQAFGEAITHFESKGRLSSKADRHNQSQQYPLHDLVKDRPTSAPSVGRPGKWRHDPVRLSFSVYSDYPKA